MTSFSPCLECKRLILRGLSISDASALFSIFSDSEVMRYWSTPPWHSIEDAHRSINAWLSQVDGQEAVTLGIFLRDQEKLIGKCDLFNIHEKSRRAEIGYLLHRDYWGHGYMTEAASTLLDYGFNTLNLRRIEADVDVDNIASINTLKKLGFVHEGTLRERWDVQGIISDSEIYGLLNTDRRSI